MWHIWLYFHFLYIFFSNSRSQPISMSCLGLYIQVARCPINLGIPKPSDSPWNNHAVTHLKLLWKSKTGCYWMKIPSYSKPHVLHSIPAIPLRTQQYLISRHNPLLSLPEQNLALKALLPCGPKDRPPAPGEKHKDPRVLPELERNQCAKTQGKAREPQAPAQQLHLPRCQERWFSHQCSRGACPGSCRSWRTQPQPLPGGRTAGTEPTPQPHHAPARCIYVWI